MGIFDSLLNTIGVGKISEMISERFGIEKSKVQTVVSVALPLLIAAFVRNTKSSQGANALSGALAKDHDGSILDNIANIFTPQGAQDGAGILGHLLGGSQGNLINTVSQQSGVQGSQVSSILGSLAPLLMGFLGKEQRDNNLDAGGLGGLIQNMGQEVGQQQPGMLDSLAGMIDKDGDGPMDDLMNMGKGLLGGLFK